MSKGDRYRPVNQDRYGKNYDTIFNRRDLLLPVLKPKVTVVEIERNSMDSEPKMREFNGGATRDIDAVKLDYEGFNNPLVDRCYAEYLNKHRQTANGLRDSDNWQSLFGKDHFNVCMKSLCRHVVDARLAHRGYESEQSIIDSLNAVIFNAKAYLLKLLLDEENYNAAIDHEIGQETTPGGENRISGYKKITDKSLEE